MLIIPGTGLFMGLSGVGCKPDALPDGAVFLNQVHSSRIVMNPSGAEKADGMIMRRGSGIPALKVADCLPVFAVWDDYVGAAHAGWRGLASGIIENLLRSVDQPLRWFVTGPCICGNCYEVGDEVRRAVTAGDPSGGTWHLKGRLDLRESAVRRARNICGEHFQVTGAKRCTLESASLFSYRADETADRNILWLAEIEHGEHIRQPSG